MRAKLKSFFVIALKNAVNAILLNSGLMLRWSHIFNIHTTSGILDLLQATGMIVAAREAIVWGPKLLKWSSTETSE
jgi:hypothetical protein